MHTAALLGEAAKEAVAFGWHEKVDMQQFPPNTVVEVLASDKHTWLPATLIAPKVSQWSQSVALFRIIIILID